MLEWSVPNTSVINKLKSVNIFFNWIVYLYKVVVFQVSTIINF